MKTEKSKTRTLNRFRALLRIFRLEKQLIAVQREADGAWTNRNLFCRHINIIGKEIIGPRIGSFQGDCCSPEAVSRETRNLIEKLEAENAELRRQLINQ